MEFKRESFVIDLANFTFDNWGVLPDADYEPRAGRGELGSRLPEDWSNRYKYTWRQYFQPNKFYRNCALLVNLARTRPEFRTPCVRLFEELQERLLEYSVEFDGARYVVNRFDFVKQGLSIPGPWHGSIMNAFAIAGLIKAMSAFPSVVAREAIPEFARAFTVLRGEDVLVPWISGVDEDGYLWFEEYPLKDGSGSRVQNGHIFSIFALAMYQERLDDSSVRPYVEGGLTSIKHNALRYRRPGDVALYDLRDPNYVDYAPLRAVKQHAQLYALTGDYFFRGMAYILAQDLVDSGAPGLPDWVLAPAETATTLHP